MASQNSGRFLPELVIVPAQPGPGGPEMETRYASDGLRVVLPVFTSVASLVARLGHEQPWICVPLAEARQAVAGTGLAGVVVDPGETP